MVGYFFSPAYEAGVLAVKTRAGGFSDVLHEFQSGESLSLLGTLHLRQEADSGRAAGLLAGANQAGQLVTRLSKVKGRRESKLPARLWPDIIG